MSWTEPSTSGVPAITSYDLRYILSSADDSVDSNWTEVSSAWTSGDLEYTIAGLSPSSSYKVQVRALNSEGTSPWSVSVEGTTFPAQPTDVQAVPGDGQVTLRWTDPSDSTISRYQLQQDGAAWADVPGSGATTTSHTVTGLTNDVEHTFAIKAISSVGAGPPSETITARPSECYRGTAVADPYDNLGLVGDCAVLLNARDTLAGTASLNWSGQLPIAAWEGVEISEDPQPRVSAIKLRDKSLTGSIPPSLGNLTGLTRLDLFNNNITGTIPTEIGNLTALEYLNLGWNDLTGPIPKEIGNLTALTQLWLGGNDLTGPIPKEIGNLTALTQLWLGWSDLTGPIPKEIGNLTALTQLLLNRNDLTGPIPKEIGNLTALTQLWLYANDLTGTIPTEIGNLTALTDLLLNDNRLTGTIPTEIGNLTALTHLWLIRNELTGPIPKEIGNLTALTWLLLSGNELTGCIPVALKNIEDHDLASLDLIYCPRVVVSNANPQEGDAVDLSVEVEGDTSYQWQVKENDTWTDVAGATAATYTVTHQTAGARTYRAVATASSGAVYTTDEVTVTWTAGDQAGTLNLSPSQPHVGTQIRATLTDPDGDVTGESWSWERSSDQVDWSVIAGADSASYTPASSDVGYYLRATVSYTDSHGWGKSAQAVSANSVQPAVFDADASYRVLTHYRRTTELELTNYLAQSVSGISFTLSSCDAA